MCCLQSCIKEASTTIEAYWTNPTTHSIHILPYKNGFVNSSDTIHLVPNNGLARVDNNKSQRGQYKSPGFDSKFGGIDSLIVLFDHQYKITHYINLPPTLSLNYYDFGDTRNITNPNNYNFSHKEQSKRNYKNTHDFIFIEQDFLDAL